MFTLVSKSEKGFRQKLKVTEYETNCGNYTEIITGSQFKKKTLNYLRGITNAVPQKGFNSCFQNTLYKDDEFLRRVTAAVFLRLADNKYVDICAIDDKRLSDLYFLKLAEKAKTLYIQGDGGRIAEAALRQSGTPVITCKTPPQNALFLDISNNIIICGKAMFDGNKTDYNCNAVNTHLKNYSLGFENYNTSKMAAALFYEWNDGKITKAFANDAYNSIV